jgi:hypothetical protein
VWFTISQPSSLPELGLLGQQFNLEPAPSATRSHFKLPDGSKAKVLSPPLDILPAWARLRIRNLPVDYAQLDFTCGGFLRRHGFRPKCNYLAAGRADDSFSHNDFAFGGTNRPGSEHKFEPLDRHCN